MLWPLCLPTAQPHRTTLPVRERMFVARGIQASTRAASMRRYKERNPERYPETVRKVEESGKTPAGAHRPIMVTEILEVLSPKPGDTAVDCTLGYGGHARALLGKLSPRGFLLGLDTDPIELPKTEARLRALGFGPEVFAARRTNFAGLQKALQEAGRGSAEVILADLGASSMQLDDPTRGFSTRRDGPLDMRMNTQRGVTAALFLKRISPQKLQILLAENSDEPRAAQLAPILAGKEVATTSRLRAFIREALPHVGADLFELTVRRVFQTLRIAVNDEFSALDALLRSLPVALSHGGRVAILTFHSGEDRRVKKAFATGSANGVYAEIARDVIRPTAEERYSNPRSTAAKLRWARRS